MIRRYLLEHSRKGTWDLIAEDDQLWIERVHRSDRKRFSLEDFQRMPERARMQFWLQGQLERARSEMKTDRQPR